ncbi:hypothetical protein [Nocardia aurea]|uniref:hypothetical protein n=1 Tax=Nocardia aurea TaxID=2144174 RepID=UPI0033B19AB4
MRFHESTGEVWLSLGGHHCEGRMPLLRMSVTAAGELAFLLSRANLDGLIGQGLVPAELAAPYRDVTCEPCDCDECTAAAQAVDRALCLCALCVSERGEGIR